MSKRYTQPFTKESSAKDFASKVDGTITTQYIGSGRSVHQVHYSPTGKGSSRGDHNEETDFNSDLNGNGTNWHTSEDL